MNRSAALPLLLVALSAACGPEPPNQADSDGDGVPDTEDCAPDDPATWPSAPDPWGDGADTDCDGSDGIDADADGWALNADPEVQQPDCADDDPEIWPGATEASPHDGVDADCNGGDGSGLEWADVILVGEQSVSLRGYSNIAGISDLDGDGLDELAIGVRHADDVGDNSGLVAIFFGATLADGGVFEMSEADVMLRAEGSWAQVGQSVASGGDFDGDGLDDLLVGAPVWGEQPGEFGAVYVVRGADLLVNGPSWSLGEAWVQLDAEVMDQELGRAVLWLGDVDGDGLDDALLGGGGNGGPDAPELIPRAGLFFGRSLVESAELVLSDADILFERSPEDGAANGGVGRPLPAPGDLDGDGRADLSLGVGNRRVRFFYSSSLPEEGGLSPAEADVVLRGPTSTGSAYDDFGISYGAGQDLNGDGLPDLLIGHPGDYDEVPPGTVYLVDGTVLASPGEHLLGEGGIGARLLGETSGCLGSGLSLGDGDGDGVLDLAVNAGCYQVGGDPERLGRAYVLPVSALPGEGEEQPIAAAVAWEGNWMGTVSTWAGDFNGDGRDDLVMVDEFDSDPLAGYRDAVHVVFSGGLP